MSDIPLQRSVATVTQLVNARLNSKHQKLISQMQSKFKMCLKHLTEFTIHRYYTKCWTVTVTVSAAELLFISIMNLLLFTDSFCLHFISASKKQQTYVRPTDLRISSVTGKYIFDFVEQRQRVFEVASTINHRNATPRGIKSVTR